MYIMLEKQGSKQGSQSHIPTSFLFVTSHSGSGSDISFVC